MMAIKSIHAGKPYVGPRATKALAECQHRSRHHGDDPYESLTAREREAFHLVIQGKTTKEIAQILDIGVKPAENHRDRLMEKLALRNRSEERREGNEGVSKCRTRW